MLQTCRRLLEQLHHSCSCKLSAAGVTKTGWRTAVMQLHHHPEDFHAFASSAISVLARVLSQHAQHASSAGWVPVMQLHSVAVQGCVHLLSIVQASGSRAQSSVANAWLQEVRVFSESLGSVAPHPAVCMFTLVSTLPSDWDE